MILFNGNFEVISIHYFMVIYFVAEITVHSELDELDFKMT